MTVYLVMSYSTDDVNKSNVESIWQHEHDAMSVVADMEDDFYVFDVVAMEVQR